MEPSNFAQAQIRETLPKAEYFVPFNDFFDGNFSEAYKDFERAARSGYRIVDSRWMDSVCYYTMLGECRYHMGDFAGALQNYNSAAQLMLANPRWLERADFPAELQQAQIAQKNRLPWGVSSRNSGVARIPEKFSYLRGRFDNDDVIQRTGGVVANLEYVPVNIAEIIRCCAVVLRRRAELLGPMAEHDPLSDQLLQIYTDIPESLHWSQAWQNSLRGFAYLSTTDKDEAQAALENAISVGNNLDHHLTGMVFLELGKLEFQKKSYQAAAAYFKEAAISAANFGHYNVVEEAIERGSQVHILSDEILSYQSLIAPAQWASKRGRSRHLEASLYTQAADIALSVHNINDAEKLLQSARRAMNKTELLAGELGARYHFQLARVHFQNGKQNNGEKALTNFLNYKRNSSRWLFQVALADEMYLNQGLSSHLANQFFEEYLPVPRKDDWLLQPQEALCMTLFSHDKAWNHWLDLAMQRERYDEAFVITERQKRRRFYSSLAIGGRSLAFYWILGAPEERLSREQILKRQDLFLKYPELKVNHDHLQNIHKNLLDLSLTHPADSTEANQQINLYHQFSQAAASQQLMIWQLMLERIDLDYIFPPIRTVEELQEELGSKELVLAFHNTETATYAFLLSSTNFAHWRLESPGLVKNRLVTLLKKWGNGSSTSRITEKQLELTTWQEDSHVLLNLLFNNAQHNFWDNYEELTIIPDHLLWYLPFEALALKYEIEEPPKDKIDEKTTKEEEETKKKKKVEKPKYRYELLIEHVHVRYLPLMSLIPRDKQRLKTYPKSVALLGRLNSREKPEEVASYHNDWSSLTPNLKGISASQLSAQTAYLKTLVDYALVWQNINNTKEIYNWAPLGLDSKTPGGKLTEWPTGPFGAPDVLVLPGFHTDAETSLRNNGNGQEIFLNLCALAASGSRTVLLSRWKTGGESQRQLLKEFTETYHKNSAPTALQAAILNLWSVTLNDETEPRIRKLPQEHTFTAKHPFFWAGNLLMDFRRLPENSQSDQ
ncbi:MAG: CHAT domain-containing protein [Pirellulaceae bacterium]|nr:CHAT domain-containing protein [Pirellulaceae bacterium]